MPTDASTPWEMSRTGLATFRPSTRKPTDLRYLVGVALAVALPAMRLVTRELVFRLLTGEQGGRLRHVAGPVREGLVKVTAYCVKAPPEIVPAGQ